ncbi:2',3'-cyclic-nucleotide 2'-phosphodiesterase, partial [Clostridium perfringens]|nr:2',3'-cyclic-nucleotide 2'-phosphodiesterase [Clostridium perfringens]
IRLYQYDMFDGISYEINISKPAGKRIENVKFEKDGKAVGDNDIVYLSVNNYRYDSILNATTNPVFEPGTHEKIYDTNNDKISDMRDLITDYIVKVNDGTIKRNIDNNWKLTGVTYDEALRAQVVKLVNEGKLQIPKSEDGRTPNVKSLTWIDVLKALNTKRVDIMSFNDFH